MSRSCLIPAATQREGNDPIFALHGEAVQRAEAGESILNSTLGALMDDEGHLVIMPSVSEVIAGIPPESAASYAPIIGDPLFREAVIADVVPADLVSQAVAVATPGCTGAIHHAMMNFLEAGQAALAPSYYWGPYQTIANHTGRSVQTFNMFDEETRLDLENFEATLSNQMAEQGRALVLFNFPCNNPTGYSLDEAEWAAVADVIVNMGKLGPVAFLLDHAYARFGSDASNRWVEHLPKMLESATVLIGWTISKSFAQYGARVGALVALNRDSAERELIANALGYSCRATWSNCNHLGLLAAATLLTDPALRERSTTERAGMIRLLNERVEVFNDLAGLADLHYPRYEGGFFVSVFTPDADRTADTMRESGVFVIPMPGAVRVALCTIPVSTISRLVDALDVGVRSAKSIAP
jgi:aromatic-amino-acid transaminase